MVYFSSHLFGRLSFGQVSFGQLSISFLANKFWLICPNGNPDTGLPRHILNRKRNLDRVYKYYKIFIFVNDLFYRFGLLCFVMCARNEMKSCPNKTTRFDHNKFANEKVQEWLFLRSLVPRKKANVQKVIKEPKIHNCHMSKIL